MPIDTNWLLLSLLISCIGSGLFIYGMRQTKALHMLVGAAFAFYPYFVPNLWVMALIAVVLGAGLWFAARLGW